MKAPHANIPSIGLALRSLRHKRHMTLESLAQDSGVSRSMLSQIERGKSNPTFVILVNLSKALAVSLDELVSGDLPKTPFQRTETLTAHNTPERQPLDAPHHLKMLSPMELGGHIEWYLLEFPQDGAMESPTHEPGTHQQLTCIQGKLEISHDTTSHTIRRGETLRYAANTPHTITNRTGGYASGYLFVLSDEWVSPAESYTRSSQIGKIQ